MSVAAGFASGAIDPETLYTKQTCIGKGSDVEHGYSRFATVLTWPRRRQFRQGIQRVPSLLASSGLSQPLIRLQS